MKLASIASEEEKQASHKRDLVTSFSAVTPYVQNNEVLFLTKNKQRQMTFTKRGLNSYFDLIKIPKKFFNQCSVELRQRIVREFHRKALDKNVMIRLYDDKIRFVASDKYQKFDDIEVITGLKNIDENIVIRDFYQDLHFSKIRFTSKDSIVPCEGKVFYPGIQIINSEAGLSSVRIDYLLYEEICTNGTVLTYDELPGLKMRHIGKPDGLKLAISASDAIKNLPEIRKVGLNLLKKAHKTRADKAINYLKNSKINIALDYVEFLAENYRVGNQLSALDIVSGYTEYIKDMDVDVKLKHEKNAGAILQRITSD